MPNPGQDDLGVRPSGVVIRPPLPAEASFTAQLHADALPHGFFVSLGQAYLRIYYLSFFESPHARSLVAELDGELIGFVVGVVDPEAHRHFTLRRYGLRLALEGMRALFRRPGLGVRFVSTRLGRYTRGFLRTLRARATPRGPVPAERRVGVLSHLAVVRSARGCGVGETLVGAFVDAASRAGVGRLVLLTRADEGATGFYERLQWRRGEELVDGEHGYVKFTLVLR